MSELEQKPSRRLWIFAAAMALALHLGGVALAIAHLRTNDAGDGLGAANADFDVEMASPHVADDDLPPGPDAEATQATPQVAEQKAEVKETELPKDRPMEAEDPDRIVRRAYQDVLGRDPDPSGLRTFRSRIIDDGWTEAQVRDELRNSREFRERNSMSPDRAREIVRRAYLNILRREPDPASNGFVERVLRDHWTQEDVERELRKSDEYRRRG